MHKFNDSKCAILKDFHTPKQLTVARMSRPLRACAIVLCAIAREILASLLIGESRVRGELDLDSANGLANRNDPILDPLGSGHASLNALRHLPFRTKSLRYPSLLFVLRCLLIGRPSVRPLF